MIRIPIRICSILSIIQVLRSQQRETSFSLGMLLFSFSAVVTSRRKSRIRWETREMQLLIETAKHIYTTNWKIQISWNRYSRYYRCSIHSSSLENKYGFMIKEFQKHTERNYRDKTRTVVCKKKSLYFHCHANE